MTYEEITRLFDVRHRNGNSCQCICPSHKDKTASLTITKGDNGKVLLHCHANCSTEDVLQKVGLSMHDLNEDYHETHWMNKIEWYYSTNAEWNDIYGNKHTGYGDGVKVIAEYPYYDELGKYLYSKIRIEGGLIDGKLIRYYFVDKAADKANACKRDDSPHVLYKLPNFLKYRNKVKNVFIVEGEKDVETLLKIGFCATTMGSASDWRKDFARHFKGLNVIILRDNDNAGKKCAETIKNDLLHYAHSVSIVNPSENDHGDVTDYIQREGGTAEKLKDMFSKPEQSFTAKWVCESSSGRISINSGILADCIAENEKYIIVRNSEDDKEMFYLYRNGVYERCNKSTVKAMIKDYIPSAYVTENLLNNVYGLLFASYDHICKMDDFNSDTRYINFRNGLYNIETRKLEPHNENVLSTIQFDFDYAPESKNMNFFKKYIEDLARVIYWII